MAKSTHTVDSSITELRVFRGMIASVVIAVAAAAMFAPWRVTMGLVLGGGLSLLNYHWLRSSVAALFDVDPVNAKPRVEAWRYLIRYFVVGIIVFGAYWLRIVSLPAAIAGLCAFVPALFMEAVREFYFAFINREESF
jgi:preprotein translocase subunit SecY